MRRRTDRTARIVFELLAVFLLAAVCLWSGWVFGLATAAHFDTPDPVRPAVPAVQPVVRSLS